MSGLLVADTVTESFDIDQLLDKPFDELTPSLVGILEATLTTS